MTHGAGHLKLERMRAPIVSRNKRPRVFIDIEKPHIKPLVAAKVKDPQTGLSRHVPSEGPPRTRIRRGISAVLPPEYLWGKLEKTA